MTDQNSLSLALCFKCASIYNLSRVDEYTCPFCHHSVDETVYTRILNYAKTVVYYGYDYRKEYEKQVYTNGKITKKHALFDPATIACFLGIAALSGVIGGSSYDLVKKVINKIMNNSKKIDHNIGQDKILITNETDIKIFLQYIQEFHAGKLSAVDEVKSEIAKETIIWNLTNTLFPVLSKGDPSREKIYEAVKKAFDDYKNADKPLPIDFDSFWEKIDDK